ncbi:putative polyubiquitin [Usnea florida]
MRPSRSSSNASSTSTSSSSSSPSTDNFQIFVKLLSGDTIPLTVPSDTTIPTLRQLLSLRTSAPTTSIRLVHAGKHLTTPTHPISALLPPSSTLHMALPLRGGMPAPGKKQKCTFKDCKDGAQRIVGDCSFCQGHFCGKHRMLEDHKCSGLEDCKKESHERNADTLNTQRTLAVKGI